MTDWAHDFMHRREQLFPRTLGEIVAKLLKARFTRDTAKVIARRYDMDPATGKNVVRGHVSERSLMAILTGEGEDVHELLDAIGFALTGETHDQWKERRLTKIIEEAGRAHEKIRHLRTRAQLLAEASLDGDETSVLESRSGHGDPPRNSRKRSG